MSNALPMTTESNLSPPPRQPIDWSRWSTLAAIAALGLTLWFNLDHRFEVQQQQLQQQQDRMDRGFSEVRQLIQASESGRQADARAINARVDAAEQLMVASSPLPYRCPPIG